MFKHSKGIIHLFLILILGFLSIGALGYLAYKNGQEKITLQNSLNSPTQYLAQSSTANSDFSGWKIYTNEKYKYSVKYPENWFILRDDEHSFRLSNEYFDPALDGTTPLPGEIFIDFYYSHSALENYSPNPVESNSAEGVRIIKQGRFIDNSNSFGIITTQRKEEPDLEKTTETVNQILSTFKITNNFESDGWTEYQREKSNYLIKYPKEWRVNTNDIGGIVEIYRPDLYSGGDNNPHGSLIIEELYVIPASEQKLLTQVKAINGIEMKCKENNTSSLKLDCWVKIPQQERYLNIEQIKDKNSEINILVDQILSTFKFKQ